ncbi:unnamed protein product, partial [Onchocerca flexuosa]|uniref:CYTB_CTER domain-containing protein n=1 Tax=Onchocerca flexuosa TaxID=387005 RepID=A0A183HXR0_9BILA
FFFIYLHIFKGLIYGRYRLVDGFSVCENTLNDPIIFVESDSITTPAHVVPEWYFLFAFTILRSVPISFHKIEYRYYPVMVGESILGFD